MITDELWHDFNSSRYAQIREIVSVSLTQLLHVDLRDNHWQNRNFIHKSLSKVSCGFFTLWLDELILMWMLQSSWPPSITKTTPEKNEIKYILKKKLRLTKKKGSFFHLKITQFGAPMKLFSYQSKKLATDDKCFFNSAWKLHWSPALYMHL